MKVWGGHKTYFAHHRVLLTERDVSTATVVTRNGAPAIELVFAGDAREELLRLTRNNVGRTLGIIIDGELQSTSDIDAPIDNGTVVVTGHMLEYGAKRCSRALMRQVTGT